MFRPKGTYVFFHGRLGTYRTHIHTHLRKIHILRTSSYFLGWSEGWNSIPKRFPSSFTLAVFLRLFLLTFPHTTTSRIARRKFVRVCLCLPFPPSPSYVRSMRKFPFPQDKLHFTANLFPALVRRKSVSRTPSHHPSFIL